MRDHWYHVCERLFDQTGSPGRAVESIYDLFTVEEIEQLAVHNTAYVLGSAAQESGLAHSRFSFTEEEFVHPLIVRELHGWISDTDSTIVGVDLESANRSNRFFGDVSVREPSSDSQGKSVVGWQDSQSSFHYCHVATTRSAVEIVRCHDWGGGSTVFGTIALFCLEWDRAIESDQGSFSSRDRAVLKILGQFPLANRYEGEIRYANGVLKVGPDRGPFRLGQKAAWMLPIL